MSSPRIPYLHAELQTLTRALARQHATTDAPCAQLEAQVEALMIELSQLEGQIEIETSTLLRDIEETHHVDVCCGSDTQDGRTVILDPRGRALEIKLSCLHQWWSDGTLHARLPELLNHLLDPQLLDCVRLLVEEHLQDMSHDPCLSNAMMADWLDQPVMADALLFSDPDDE